MAQVVGPVIAVALFLGFSYFTTSILYRDEQKPRTKKEYYKQQYYFHSRKSKEHKKQADIALRNYNRCK